jgi:hypothetical protein
MRSEVTAEAIRTRSRFALCHLAFKAIRKLHKPSNRIADTANDAFRRLAVAGPQPLSTNPGDKNEPAGHEVKREREVIAFQPVVTPEPPLAIPKDRRQLGPRRIA